MKKIFLLIILEILLFSNIQAQIITQEQKDSIITDLNSTQWATVDYAKDGVIFYKIYEALPLLQSEIWNKNNYSRLSFVKAMFGLEFESTINYALALFDSLTENMYSEYDTIFIKLDLIEILFELNNFSKIYYLSYYTNPPYSKPYNYKIIKLWGYLLNVPEYTQLAKAKLQTLMSESTDETDRSLSLFLLGKKYKEEISPLVIARFSTESAFSIRVTILSEYFPLGEAELVSEILRSSLEIENNSSMQRMIINYLLDSLNTPSNFNFIKNWLEGEGSNSRLKKTINILIEYGNKGNPIIPSQNSNVDEIVDSTQSYLIQCNNYGWIENTEFVNDLQSILQSAKSELQGGDSVACAVQVKAFQDLVDNVYADSLNTDPRFVALEGWKFLYWNAQYILDRLPSIPVQPLISTYSLLATHSLKLNQYSVIVQSGDIGVNEAGLEPFLDPGYELSVGANATTPAGYKVKANRIKLNQNSVINGDIYYNQLNNSQGIINGTETTPLELPLFIELTEFKTSIPGTENIIVSNGQTRVLSPGSYGDVTINKNGTLVLTGGLYHFNGFVGGQQSTIKYQSSCEIRIAGKLDIGKLSNVIASDTTTYSAKDIVFYVGGINGTDGTLGATPKAAVIGTDSKIKANLYVPNGTLQIKANSEAEGSFIGKDVDIDAGVKVKLKSAF